MAATVGATLSGVTFPLRHAGLGPFKSSAGNIYFFGRDSVNTGHMEPHKSGPIPTTYTITASADDQRVFRLGSAVYPPNTTISRNTTLNSITPQNTFAVEYRVDNGLLRFDTSATADDATLLGTTLRLYFAGAATNANSRNLVGEWVSWDGVSNSDYTATPGNNAFTMPLSSITAAGYIDISLSAPSNVSKTGYTYLRLGIDGGQPTGVNSVSFFSADNGSNQPQLVVNEPANPITGSFTAQTTKLMSSGATTAIEAASCYQAEDVIHVATQLANGSVYYNQYNMATDAWLIGTSQTVYTRAVADPTAGYSFVSLVVRSTGEVVCCFAYGLHATMSGFNRVAFKRRSTGGTWADNAGTATATAATQFDNGGSVNWSNPVAVLGQANRVHFFLKDHTNTDLYQRTLTAANALQTFPATFEASGTGSVIHGTTAGISYTSGASVVVAVPYRSAAANSTQSVARLTSSDAPTVSVEVVSAVNPGATSEQVLYSLANDANDLHYLYTHGVSPNVTISRDTDGGSGAWGVDVAELTGGTANYKHSVNVYERPTADKKLALVVDDNGTIKYAEIDLPDAAVLTPVRLVGMVGISGEK